MTQTDTPLDVRSIAPASISPDPDNPRSKLRDLDALTASVKLHGVLEPITVRPDPKSNGSGPLWVVVRGHRRHAAALKAKADLIPCVVDWSDDAKIRAQHRLVENLQRDDLTATEQAKGVQQLLDLGLSEEEVAAGLSVSTDHVARAKRIQSSKAVAKTTQKMDLSFDQAAGLAEFDGDVGVVKELTDTLMRRPESFAYELEQHRQERADREIVEAKEAELKEQGFKILEDRPWGTTDYGSKEVPLRYLRANASAKAALTSAGHKDCPGRAVCVELHYDGKILLTEACADWKKNGHASVSGESNSGGRAAAKPDADLTAAEKRKADKEKRERRTHLACLRAGHAAEVVRRRFVSELLARPEAPKGTLSFAVPALLGHHLTNPKTDTFCELTGMKKPSGHGTNVVGKYVEALTEKQLPLGLLATVAAHIEKTWEPSTWKGAWGLERRNEYIRFLVSCGYEVSLIEKVILGEAKATEVLAEAERIKAAARA